MSSKHVLECLPETLSTHGDRPAILAVGEDDVRTMSYARLADDVERFAHAMASGGIRHGDRVAIFADAQRQWIVTCLALIRRGATTVPIDTQIGDQQLVRILDDAGAVHVFADDMRASRLDDIDFDGNVLRLGSAANEMNDIYRLPDADNALLDAPGADDVALLFYTSGTTGPPKGVPLRHRHLRFQTDAMRAAGIVTPDDRLLLPLPLHHVYPLVVGVLVPLSLGVPIILPHALTGPELVRTIRMTNATIIIAVPRLYASLLDGIESRIDSTVWPLRVVARALIGLCASVRARTDINLGRLLLQPVRAQVGASIRLLASGGARLAPRVAERLQGLGWDVAVGYGLTETAPILTFNPPGSRRVDAVGRPLHGIDIRIDTEARPEAAEDRAAENPEGEILARGPGVFDGYLHLEKETEQAFTDGWYRTGDLGWVDEDGYLHVSGRKSTMIVTSSGENIRTEALEEAYAEHPLIEEIGILQSGDELVAVVYPDLEQLGDEVSSVRSSINDAVDVRGKSLPSYQRLDQIRISRQPLEKTRLGKIKRHKLEDRYNELGSGEASAAAEPMAISDMSKEDRRRLRDDHARKAWALLVKRYNEHPLSPDSNFRLDLGVDSLGWLDLSMEIARGTGVELREEHIVRIDSVRDLLDVIAERPESTGELKTPLEEPESVLSDDQKRWLERPSTAALLVRRALTTMNRGMMRLAFGVRSENREALGKGPLVIAPNHASFLDPFALAAALPRDLASGMHWGGWTGYAFRNPVFRAFSRLNRVIPIDPERAIMSSLALAAAVLKNHQNLVWFPEGERSWDGRLAELRPGIGALLETFPDVVVVPVAITGAFEAWPRDRRLPRLRRIHVRFGDAVCANTLAREGDGDSRRDCIVDGLHRRMMATVAGMSGDDRDAPNKRSD